MADVAKSGTPSISSIDYAATNKVTELKAGEALGAWDACYIKASDGLVYKATGAANTRPAHVDGYSMKAVSIGQAVTLSQGNCNVGYGSGLTPGTEVFLSGAVAGAVADAASTGGLTRLGVVLDAYRIRFFSIR
jgi:hypothetical protein